MPESPWPSWPRLPPQTFKILGTRGGRPRPHRRRHAPQCGGSRLQNGNGPDRASCRHVPVLGFCALGVAIHFHVMRRNPLARRSHPPATCLAHTSPRHIARATHLPATPAVQTRPRCPKPLQPYPDNGSTHRTHFRARYLLASFTHAHIHNAFTPRALRTRTPAPPRPRSRAPRPGRRHPQSPRTAERPTGHGRGVQQALDHENA